MIFSNSNYDTMEVYCKSFLWLKKQHRKCQEKFFVCNYRSCKLYKMLLQNVLELSLEALQETMKTVKADGITWHEAHHLNNSSPYSQISQGSHISYPNVKNMHCAGHWPLSSHNFWEFALALPSGQWVSFYCHIY